MDVLSFLSGGLGGAVVTAGATTIARTIDNRRHDRAIRRQVEAMLQVALTHLSLVCKKDTQWMSTLVEIHKRIDERLFEADVAAAFKERELTRLFDFALPLRTTADFLVELDKFKSTVEKPLPDEALVTARNNAIVAVAALERCLDFFDTLRVPYDAVMRSLRSDDPERFASFGSMLKLDK
jgi:hypothetical protein